jgi:3-dehydroquinate synthase
VNYNLKDDLVKLILHSVTYKCGIVAQDPFEKSRRKVLNFGHTVGHALEGYYNNSGDRIMMHGDAVAAGMVCEAFISTVINNLPDRELKEIVSVIQSVYDLHKIKDEDFGELLELMTHDKKNTLEGLNFTLLESIGRPETNCIVDQKIILDSFRYTNELIKQ